MTKETSEVKNKVSAIYDALKDIEKILPHNAHLYYAFSAAKQALCNMVYELERKHVDND